MSKLFSKFDRIQKYSELAAIELLWTSYNFNELGKEGRSRAKKENKDRKEMQ